MEDLGINNVRASVVEEIVQDLAVEAEAVAEAAHTVEVVAVAEAVHTAAAAAVVEAVHTVAVAAVAEAAHTEVAVVAAILTAEIDQDQMKEVIDQGLIQAMIVQEQVGVEIVQE